MFRRFSATSKRNRTTFEKRNSNKQRRIQKRVCICVCKGSPPCITKRLLRKKTCLHVSVRLQRDKQGCHFQYWIHRVTFLSSCSTIYNIYNIRIYTQFTKRLHESDLPIPYYCVFTTVSSTIYTKPTHISQTFWLTIHSSTAKKVRATIFIAFCL